MRIGIVSDTHLPQDKIKRLDRLKTYFSDVDYIIHCGDYGCSEVLHRLEKWAPVHGVWGNGDDHEIRKLLPEKRILSLGNVNIGVYHGHGENGKTVDRAYKAFEGESVDIILFGHSHQPSLQTKHGILMVNCGSPTAKRKEKRYSVALLTIEEDIRCEFIFYNEK